MSEHQHPSDRKAAYTGLIFGAIMLGILLYGIVFLTKKHYEGREGAKPAAGSTPEACPTPLPPPRAPPASAEGRVSFGCWRHQQGGCRWRLPSRSRSAASFRARNPRWGA